MFAPSTLLSRDLLGRIVLWNADGIRGIVVPLGNPHWQLQFRNYVPGQLGAEAP